MKFFCFVFLAFFFPPLILSSQAVFEAFTFKKGPEINDFKSFKAAEYLGSVGTEYFIIRAKYSVSFPMYRIRLEKIDESNNLIDFIDLDIKGVKQTKQRCAYHSGFLFGNSIILVYHTLEEPFSIYYQAFDLQLKEISETQLINPIESKSKFLLESRVRVITKKSEDASKLLVFYLLSQGKYYKIGEEVQNESGFCVMNDKLEKLNEKTIGYPIEPVEFISKNSYQKPGFGASIEIDNEGTVYMLALKYGEKEQDADSSNGNGFGMEYNILNFSPGNEEINELPISGNDSFIKEALLKILPSGNLFFTYKHNDNKAIPTVYKLSYFLINTTSNSIEKEEVITISSEEILKYKSERSRNDAKKSEAKGLGYAFTAFEFNDFISTTSGSYLVLEKQHAQMEPTTGNDVVDIPTNYIYSADDMMVIVLNDRYEKTSVEIIPKNQYSKTSWEYLSYTAFEYKDGIVFLLNDNTKNEAFELNEKTHQWKEDMKGTGELAGYFIDSSGNLKRYSLYKSSSNDFIDITMSRGMNSILDSDLVFFGKSKNQVRFIRMTINKE
jgi:hypothetical protein